jgi:exosortase B
LRGQFPVGLSFIAQHTVRQDDQMPSDLSNLDAEAPSLNHFGTFAISVWLPVVGGLLALYVPSLVGMFQGVWATDEQAHGPIVLSIAFWLAYRKWPEMWRVSQGNGGSAFGWPVVVIGLMLYILGRSQQIIMFEIGSLIWVLSGTILLLRGGSALKAQWFPLLFICFMVPLPGPVVDGFTMPMKMAASYAAENVLYWVGYPIARSGVVLQIGPYKLLVAEACAGLHTLLSLEAMGLLYLNLVRHGSTLRNVVLALLIVPISFIANVIRVMALTVITYHFGDQAGQGFLHGFSGIVLYVSALLLIMGLDSLVRIGARSPPLVTS